MHRMKSCFPKIDHVIECFVSQFSLTLQRLLSKVLVINLAFSDGRIYCSNKPSTPVCQTSDLFVSNSSVCK